MSEDWAIKIEHLSKVYKIFDKPTDRVKEALNPFRKRYSRDFYALNDVSLTIKKGETVGIIGKNGAGKSTILKIITGVLTPTSGSVQVDGRIASLLELGAGFNPEMTGIENVYMNGTIMGYTKEEMDDRLQDIIDFADIGEFIHQPVKMYSSGMFARLAFSVNAFVEPDILIVDEALSVGDMKFQVKCMDKMESLMKGGCTVIFVSHDINAIRRLCHRTFFFNQGQLLADGEANTVADRYLEFLEQPDKRIDIHRNSARDIFYTSNDLGNIVSFKVMNFDGIEKDTFEYNEPLKIVVEYNVKDAALQNVVLGIALHTSSNKYVCGLNTLLDGVSIPWKVGKNKFCLKYPIGLLALSGKYHFDVALEEKTATVPIHYIENVMEIDIASEYVSEGIYTIPHDWSSEI